LTYEDDVLEDPTRAYSKICEFLGVPPGPAPQIRHARTTPFGLREVVENYLEVEQHLSGTPFARMLQPLAEESPNAQGKNFT
jgi:hypothetical protein